MKKSDLKDGMVVTIRGGQQCILIERNLFKNNFTLNSTLFDYNEDLTHKKNKNNDVVKVFGIGKLKELWERKEIDWSKVPVGTKVLVSDNENNWYEHLFIDYRNNEDFKFKCIDAKSKQIHNWKYCKLAEKPKEEVTKGELKKEYLDFMEPESNGYECDEEEIECLTEWILDYYNVTRK